MARTSHEDTTRKILTALGDVGISIPTRLWDGTELGPAGTAYRLVLHDPSALRRMLLRPSELSAGEAYIYGEVDVEGDLVAAIHDLRRLREVVVPWRARAAIARQVIRLPPPSTRNTGRAARPRGKAHTPERDRHVIKFHYDVGNDFYRHFLDRSLVYSCAYFASPDEPLDDAQVRKLDLVCRKLRLRPGMHLLDVGCGWGALVIHAARRYGVTALGVTLSQEQAALGGELVARNGLAEQVTIELADYREIDGTFDAVASVGMVEHVGPDKLTDYFRTMHHLTARGGLFLNHGITTGSRGEVRDFARNRETFIARYVFPDGGLVPSWQMARRADAAGFEVVDVEQLRPHYALTLRRWVANLERNHEKAVRVASEVDYRIWRAYMAGSAVGFESGDLGIVQVLGSKGAALPLGRKWMTPDVESTHRAR